MPYSIQLAGTIVVTGGSRGVGQAIARAVANAGADVAILHKSYPPRSDVAAAIAKDFGVQAKAYTCDVSCLEEVNEAMKAVNKDFKRPIIGLSANAGVSVVKPAVDLSTDDFHHIYNTNVLGVFNCCKVVAKHWIDKKMKGSIVATSSMSAWMYNQISLNEPLTQLFYNSSKAAVTNMVKGMAAEWAKHGIRVNALEPGYVNTDMTKSSTHRGWQAASVPLRRFSEPHEQAEPIVMLFSEKTSYMTGSSLRIDGGYSIY